jgi:sugar diacid utilization regulator
LLTRIDGMVAALLAVGGDDEHRQVGASIADQIPTATVALGRVATVQDLGPSFEQALYLARSPKAGLVAAAELGPLELIMGINRFVTTAYVNRILGNMMDEVVLSSIEALFDAGFNWRDAARKMRVHRHTIRFRVDKFVRTTGVDILNPQHRLEVWLALKARRIGRAPTSN